MIQLLQKLSNDFSENDIMEVEKGDVWIVLPPNMLSRSLIPSPVEPLDFSKSVDPSSGYKECKIEKDLDKRIACRWRICGLNIGVGYDIFGEFSKPPLPSLYTYLAIVFGALGILLSVIGILLQ